MVAAIIVMSLHHPTLPPLLVLTAAATAHYNAAKILPHPGSKQRSRLGSLPAHPGGAQQRPHLLMLALVKCALKNKEQRIYLSPMP